MTIFAYPRKVLQLLHYAAVRLYLDARHCHIPNMKWHGEMSGNIPRLLASGGEHREGGFLLSPSELFIMVAH